METIRDLIRRRPLLVAGGLLAVAVIAAVGIAGAGSMRISEMENEIVGLETQSSSLASKLEGVEDEAASAHARAADARERVRTAERRAAREAKAELADQRADLDQ